MPGSEALNPGPGGAMVSGWTTLITPGANAAKPADFSLAESTMKYLVFTPPKADYARRNSFASS
jgi:hypothetical protein